MSYIDYLINGGLTLLVLFGLTGVILGFASTVTNSEYGGRIWPWALTFALGVVAVVFAASTLMFRGQSW